MPRHQLIGIKDKRFPKTWSHWITGILMAFNESPFVENYATTAQVWIGTHDPNEPLQAIGNDIKKMVIRYRNSHVSSVLTAYDASMISLVDLQLLLNQITLRKRKNDYQLASISGYHLTALLNNELLNSVTLPNVNILAITFNYSSINGPINLHL